MTIGFVIGEVLLLVIVNIAMLIYSLIINNRPFEKHFIDVLAFAWFQGHPIIFFNSEEYLKFYNEQKKIYENTPIKRFWELYAGLFFTINPVFLFSYFLAWWCCND